MTSLLDADEMGDGSPAARGQPGLRHLPVQRKKAAATDTAADDPIPAEIYALAQAAAARHGARLDADVDADPKVTEALVRAAGGDAAALGALIPQIYATLRRLARRQRAHEAAHTLETTALVHEAYLKLASQGDLAFADRAHLYAYMSRVMRHLLIDHARRRKAQKRQAPELAGEPAASDIVDVLAIDEALTRLGAVDARLARVAELRLFADLSSPEIAEVVGINARTVERDWLKARTFLSACLQPDA